MGVRASALPFLQGEGLGRGGIVEKEEFELCRPTEGISAQETGQRHY